jgi:hypothetical protein
VPTTKAASERGPKILEDIFDPIPRTDDGGASPSQYEDIFKVLMGLIDTPIRGETDIKFV